MNSSVKIKKIPLSPLRRKEEKQFYLAVLPWILGFVLLTIGPMVVSFFTSFTVWNGIRAPRFVGLDNFVLMFKDKLLGSSIRITLTYVITAVPSSLLLALLLAMMLNKGVPGTGFFQTMFYFPATVSGVAVYMAWGYLYDPLTGILNYMLSLIGIEGPAWLASTKWALPALVIMNLFFCGGPMLIFLAGLKQIPRVYYEAAQIDGATSFKLFWYITLPQLTPVMVFNLIMGLIHGLQVFSQAFAMTAGGPAKSTYFYVFYLYQTAFKFQDFGYASAMAWSMFAVIMFLSFIAIKARRNKGDEVR